MPAEPNASDAGRAKWWDDAAVCPHGHCYPTGYVKAGLGCPVCVVQGQLGTRTWTTRNSITVQTSLVGDSSRVTGTRALTPVEVARLTGIYHTSARPKTEPPPPLKGWRRLVAWLAGRLDQR